MSTGSSSKNDEPSSSLADSAAAMSRGDKKKLFTLMLDGIHENAGNADHNIEVDNNDNSQQQQQQHNFLSMSQAWIDLRDCVRIGKDEYRYEYDQLMYHVTKDQRYLLLD